MLVNIDNGGTLTDICVSRDGEVFKTKTLTTPYDLSKCFFEGLEKASKVVFGQPDLARFLEETDYIRYSTTQGTNAIVQRRGPKIGFVLDQGNADLAANMRAHDPELFDALIGSRVAIVDVADLDNPDEAIRAVSVISKLTSAGAARLVVCFSGTEAPANERKFKKISLINYPRHLLGAVPMLFAHELSDDADMERRAWSAAFNSFLHPAMEGFLYNAENRLRNYHTRNPLLIFRNDGGASRVAKTVALKTYSSGPRGGMEGVKRLARHYGLDDVLSMDIGGTTTDIGQVVSNEVFERRKGEVEGVAISFALCEIVSLGAGGSSVFRVEEGRITVGPDSVGAAPGPACFGRGGQEATITDANLLIGILDPATYFGGGLSLDVERARNAIRKNIAEPLGCDIDDALLLMKKAYEDKISAEIKTFGAVSDKTTLLAFGGAGPMSACGVAGGAGIKTVIIPGLAAVYSAYGIGNSDIAQSYTVTLHDASESELQGAHAALSARAERDMFAEGFAPGDYELITRLVVDGGSDNPKITEITGAVTLPADLVGQKNLELEVDAVKVMHKDSDEHGRVERGKPATPSGVRKLFTLQKEWCEVPVYKLAEMAAGDYGSGPAIIEEEYFTCRVDDGWEFTISSSGDIFMKERD
jgi:N-methylhydantoinase A/oxoprolinase/acetone carboxylase beta subunit